MAFYVCPSIEDGTRDVGAEIMLSPGPTYPEYGQERFQYKVLETEGGGVRQRLKRKTKEYKWVWQNYGPDVPRYEDQYWVLFNLQSHVRAENGDTPEVYLYEDVTGELGVYNTTTDKVEPAWIKVLITYVGRTITKDGGNVRYPETELRFLIADSSITSIR